MLGKLRFRGGVHPPHSKITVSEKIQIAKLPQRAVIPLRQHIGATCEPLVEEGDHVKAGQKIGDSTSFVSVPIHASISGTVVGISTQLSPTGDEVQSIIIESDGKDEWVGTKGIDPEKSPKEQILKTIRECGVAGFGGAAFPTHVKLSPPKEKKIDVVIINGAECEPYITADHRLMLEEGEKILKGARIVAGLLGVERIILAIENNKKDALDYLRSLSNGSIDVVSLKTKYPQGDERHLIKAVLNREVPRGGLPFDVGVVVHNIGTAKAIYDAVYQGIPLVERVVTVTGDVHVPKNLLARIGTPFSHLIEECGGFKGEAKKIISGGPMMGIAQYKDVPVVKGTSCVLVLNEQRVKIAEEKACIRCGKCIEACPMGLMPTVLAALVRKKSFDTALEYSIMSCDDCGCCAYVCPSNIPLVQLLRYGKVCSRSLGKESR
ncbi:electron transport complex subunit RsxC [Candidatus Hakubella thermalkaliphila]|nr:electron transport complex subunit RsxC [Candidatus Hakubella thermalkaliphila]